jgi:ketosteroid isomerase-like protein
MRRLTLLVLAVAAPVHAQAPAGYSAARQVMWTEIRLMNDSLEAAFNRGEPAAVARFYADGARMRGPGSPEIQGRTMVDAYWTSLRNPVRWRLEVLDVGGHRDLTYQVGRSHLTSRGPGGQERTYSTDFVVVWERQRDGSLRIILDLWN